MPPPKIQKTIKVKDVERFSRLDVFLSEKLKISRSKTQKMIDEELVFLNEKKPKKAGAKIKNEDKIIILHKTKKKIIKKNIKTIKKKTLKQIKIIAEYPDFIIINKPTGMLTHSTQKNETDSLAELLVKKYPELKNIGEDPVRPGIVHRLDKDASGLLVVARNQKMFAKLKKQFKNRKVEKEYCVLVHGQVEADEGEINLPLTRSYRTERMAARPQTKNGKIDKKAGKEAHTTFWVEKRFINFTLLKVKIHTGRMHQIRAHMLSHNNPLVGDNLYFQKKLKKTWDKKLGRLFLHSTKLSFKDLNNKKQTFESPIPNKLKKFLKIIK